LLEGVWWDLILALIGGGALTTGIIGLMMGGNLPLVRVPDSLKPAAKLGHILAMFIGLTLLLDRGTPNLAGRVVAQIMSMFS